MDGTSGAFDPGLADTLDVDGMIAVCQELVRIPSLSGDEAAAARALAECLRNLGYDRVEVDDMGNVLGWLDGSGDGPTLLYNGHLDHVPPGDMTDPYGGQLVDAERWGQSGLAIAGRGTCDMKCNVVEAADLRVYLGHRGKVEFELAIHGRMAHSSEPSRGENAIAKAAPLLAALDRHAEHLPSHPLLGQGTLAPIDIHAESGGGVAVVPDRCTIRVDRRYIPGESPDSCLAELAEIVDDLRASDRGFRCDIRSE